MQWKESKQGAKVRAATTEDVNGASTITHPKSTRGRAEGKHE
jgi:hypothetical protein